VATDSDARGQAVIQLRIQLQDVYPVVWRRLLVPGSIRLSKLADLLCATMGWQNNHLHQFRTPNALYGMHVEDWDEDEIDEKTVTVLQAFRDERRVVFDYDFGDNWHHEVVIEDLTRSSHALKFAVCVDGQNACPPEDVGGVGGYREFLEAIIDAEHDEHDHLLEWAGGSFDPAAFDLGSVNAELQRIR
jgi:hypothetical protein